MQCNLRLLHRFLDQKKIYPATTGDIAPTESLSSGREEQQQHDNSLQDFESCRAHEHEPRSDFVNSDIQLHDDMSEGLGDMNDWLDGLVWLDYLKDSNIMFS